ncbi:hypothetical protein EB796_012451 [Bugula neritina]|uniref:L-type lectin-like domain-containing protein n=1 Tax=Bugula neritina TaxID=10212 RepID=A0A7J7JSB4_BUGNE|nr:hypothetical protein EB796_012451 [Bugula neritina]
MHPGLNLFSVFFFKYLLIFANQFYNVQSEYLRREHTLTSPYTGSYWDILGQSVIMTDRVRLTRDEQSQQGGLWNIQPIVYHNWEVHIQFAIHGQGENGLHGDGFAFWYAKDPLVLGDVFGYKNHFHGLAVLLDTYNNHNGAHNHQHPYISAMINNGTLAYDHDRDGTHTELAGCSVTARNVNHETFIAVRYLDNKLSVSTDIDNKQNWEECFVVEGVHLPTGYYLGLTAATGDLADNHDIISVKFYELESQLKQDDDYSKVEPSASIFSPPRDHVDDPKPGFFSGSWSGLKLLLIIVLLCVAVGVVVLVGFLVFQRHQDNSRKRFY